jgi:hypothetical protein
MKNYDETHRQQTNSTRRFDAYTTDRHDSSADWRTEHEDVHVDPDGHVLTDGGTRSTRYVLPTEGAVVYDDLRKDGVGDELLVINVHEDTSADEVWLDELGKTVAAVNDEYDDDAPVADCVYLDELVNTLGDWDSVEGVREAVVEGTIRSYTFPVDRLSSTRGGEDE